MNFIEIIRLLCDHAMIERLENFDEYDMHICVHVWAAHMLNAEKDILMIKLTLICVDSNVSAMDILEYWTIQRQILLHACQYSTNFYDNINFESQNDDRILNIMNSFDNLYADQDKMNEIEKIDLRTLTEYEKTWSLDHTLTLNTINNLGLL